MTSPTTKEVPPSMAKKRNITKNFSRKEKRLYQKVFRPKIKRKPYNKRSIYKTCESLAKSFYPLTKASYEAVKLRLVRDFQRCSRQTILAYLGRVYTEQVEKVYHTIETETSTRTKDHTFKHRLPAKKGYLEIHGFATLCKDNKKPTF